MSINHQLYSSKRRSRLPWTAFGVVVLVVAAAAAFLVVSGHHDHSKGSSAYASGFGPSPTAPSASPAPAKLAAINVQSSDLSASWDATPYTADPTDSASEAAMVACLGAHDTTPDVTAKADSPTYKYGTASIDSEAQSFRSETAVATDIAILHNPKINSCFEKFLRRTLGEGLPAATTISRVSITVAPRTDTLPRNVAATLSGRITVSSPGKTATLYLGAAFIVGPRLEAQVDFASSGRPSPARCAQR